MPVDKSDALLVIPKERQLKGILYSTSYEKDFSLQKHFSYGGRQQTGSVYQYFGYSCEGTEGKVVDCPYTGGVCDLDHNIDIIAIACLEGGINVSSTDLTAPGSLSGDYSLRLEGGQNSCQGDLEVFIPHLGEWALAVSEVFGDDEAAVTCCELGCGPPLIRRPSIRYPYYFTLYLTKVDNG